MRSRLFAGLAVAGLTLLFAAPAAPGRPPAPEKKPDAKPAVVITVKSLDELIADARYLFTLVDKEEEGKQLEKFLKAKTGPKGLEGVDPKKPLGMYGTLGAKGLADSHGVLLLPIADEKAFLKMLDNLDLKPEKGKDGLYTLEVDNVPFPILFRFAHGYLYGTLKATDETAEALDKDKLPKPETVLPASSGSVLAMAVNIDAIPAQFKKLAIANSGVTLGDLKDQEMPGETEAQKAFRHQLLDELAVQIKTLINDGGALTLSLDLDRKKHDLGVGLRLTAKPGSALAKDITGLAGAKSVAAGVVGKDSAMHGTLRMALPDGLHKTFAPMIEEAVKKAVAAEKDKEKAALLKEVLDALKPTAKAGVLDAGFDFRGPGKGGKYTAVVGVAVKDGAAVEKALKKAVAAMPAAEKKAVTLDADKEGDVNIHKVTPDKVDKETKEMFGDGPVYLAVRKDAVLAAMGEGALEALKGAIKAAPKPGKLLHLEMAMARAAKLMEAREKGAPEAAKKAFKDKGSDTLRLTLDAGKALELRLTMKTAVLTFGNLLNKAKEEEKKGD